AARPRRPQSGRTPRGRPPGRPAAQPEDAPDRHQRPGATGATARAADRVPRGGLPAGPAGGHRVGGPGDGRADRATGPRPVPGRRRRPAAGRGGRLV
ncbi:MAG: hypothetical protein AVDCRST_MAG19-952, partial [uncultured Thermomicrobiales bacterium]